MYDKPIKPSHKYRHSVRKPDFSGPYAQNLAKPKLYEPKGLQKIAHNL